LLRLETFKLSEENVGGNFQDSGIDMEFCLRPQNHREKKKSKTRHRRLHQTKTLQYRKGKK
jgi:hypothetical protein